MSDHVILLVATIKGALMATVIILIADVSFWQGLVTAACSAFISGSFLLVSVHVTSKKTDEKVEKARTEILEGQDEVKRVVTGDGE